MAPEYKPDVLCIPNQFFIFFRFFALFVTNFVHTVAATVSYDLKELLEIRTGITHLKLDEVAGGIYYYRHPTRPRSPAFTGEGKGDFAKRNQGAL